MKKLLNLISITGLFFVLPTLAFANTCFDVTGAGTSDVNGSYTQNAGINGRPSWDNGTTWLSWSSYSGGNWSFFDNGQDGSTWPASGTSEYYLSDSAGSDPTPYTSTFFLDAGTAPVPTVSNITSCGGGGGSTTATSTPDQVQQNLFNGFLLFYLTAGGIVAFFFARFRRMN